MSGYSIPRKPWGAQSLKTSAASPLATTWSATAGLKEAFARLSAKTLAEKAQTNERTAENWKQGHNGPSWPIVCRLLQDSEMAPILLRAAGRGDLADAEKILENLKDAKRALSALNFEDNGQVIEIIPTLQADLFEQRRSAAPIRSPAQDAPQQRKKIG